MGADKIWFGVNGTWLDIGSGAGNPATGANPCYDTGLNGLTLCPMASVNYQGWQVTISTTPEDLTYPVPSGFTAIGSTTTYDWDNIGTVTSDPSRYNLSYDAGHNPANSEPFDFHIDSDNDFLYR